MKPDWEHWQPTQIVDLWQAVMLSCDEEPPSGEDSIEDELPSSASAEADRRARIAGNAVAVQLDVVRQNAAYSLRSAVELAKFAAWAIAQGWTLPGPLAQMARRESVVKKTSKAATDCEKWLVGLAQAGPQDKSKDKYFAEAKGKWPSLSRRAFDRIWPNVVPPDWSEPGRRRKS